MGFWLKKDEKSGTQSFLSEKGEPNGAKKISI